MAFFARNLASPLYYREWSNTGVNLFGLSKGALDV